MTYKLQHELELQVRARAERQSESTCFLRFVTDGKLRVDSFVLSRSRVDSLTLDRRIPRSGGDATYPHAVNQRILKMRPLLELPWRQTKKRLCHTLVVITSGIISLLGWRRGVCNLGPSKYLSRDQLDKYPPGTRKLKNVVFRRKNRF